MSEIKTWIKKEILAIVNNSQENDLQYAYREKAWDEPLVGFSNAGDSYYYFFKEDTGDFYWMPLEAFKIKYAEDIKAEELTVITYVLPQTEKTKKLNRAESVYPAENWTRSRIYGEQFNNLLRKEIVDLLTGKGYSAVAPVLLPGWQVKKDTKYGFACNWSERHAAFVAGLGTFGLCDGLITARGKAVRIGSVVAKIAAEPDKREYLDKNEYCLFYSGGKCRKCAKRCPAGAISENGHDKQACNAYITGIITEYNQRCFNIDGAGCGLCQTGVPCESGIP